MNTNSLCDAPTSLAFVQGRAQSKELSNCVTLAKDGLWRSADKHPEMSIRVVEGSVWITADGDANDYIVSAGRSFQSPARARIVVQSLSNRSQISIQ